MLKGFRPWPWPLEQQARVIGSQKLAVAILEWTTRGSLGVSESDERYRLVTERRDNGPYSSCADLAHWMLYRLGVRLDWINRTEHNGWISGVNVSRLCWLPNKAARAYTGGELLPGDVITIRSPDLPPTQDDSHVICVLEQEGDALRTAEYGQPGGALRIRTLRRVYDDKGVYKGTFIGARRIERHLPLQHVLTLAEASGELVDAEEPIP